MMHQYLSDKEFGKDGTYSIILPIDQGVEHGPVDAFTASEHPEMLDVSYQIDYIAELLNDGLISGAAIPARVAKLFCKRYHDLAGDIVVKLNHGNNLNNALHPSQAVYATSQEAKSFGAGCIGFTIYPGSFYQDQMIESFAKARNNFHGKSILWSYPRGGDFNQTSTKTIMHAAYIAAQLNPSVIKVKIPTDQPANLEAAVHSVVNAACGIPVVFSGGSKQARQNILEEARAIKGGGGRGMIIGRNTFQRRPQDAKDLLNDIHEVFA